MKSKGVIVETDLIADYLLCGQSPSVLRSALQTFTCYTTFVQISELLQCATTEYQKRCVLDAISLLRPLGSHPRYSEAIAEMLRRLEIASPSERFRCAVTGAISQQAKLPILTERYQSIYSRLEILAIMPDSIR